MIRAEILAQLGRQRLLIAPVRSEIDGVWRIKISTDDGRAVFLDTTAATQLADQLRRNGERLLATRLEIGIEQRRRCAVLEKGGVDDAAGLRRSRDGGMVQALLMPRMPCAPLSALLPKSSERVRNPNGEPLVR